MIVPVPHNGQGCPMALSSAFMVCVPATGGISFVVSFIFSAFFLGVLCFLGVFFFRSSSVVTVTRLLLLSRKTSSTICAIWTFSSSINCVALYCLCSISRNFFSHMPVSSQLVSSFSCIVSMSSIPVGVANRFFRSRRI